LKKPQRTQRTQREKKEKRDIDYPLGLETGFLCKISALISKKIEETRFLCWNLFHQQPTTY